MNGHIVDFESLHCQLNEEILSPGFVRATFGGPRRNPDSSPWLRVTIRAIVLADKPHLQFSWFDIKKDITKNFRLDEFEGQLREILALQFSAIHLSTTNSETDIRITKKGKIQIATRARVNERSPTSKSHNRPKRLPLPEGQPDRLLQAMGILTHDGKVRPTMRAKYTQINECLKVLSHVLDRSGLRNLDRPIEILDCGCGSSYLTLAVHHYLNSVLGVSARVIGVDVNEEVIRKSIDRATTLGSDRPAFACSPIGSFEASPDIVMALHACDTATDEAIAVAVKSKAKLLLSVPCCHHHLHQQIQGTGESQLFRPLLRHGILQSRTADLLTDAFRALALRIVGYQTDVIEFISPEHTARNLMIRAVLGAKPYERDFIQEFRALKTFWGVTPYIETVLGEQFQLAIQQEKSITPS